MKPKRRSVLSSRVRAFLRTPRVARLATIGADGYPHVVPIWFLRDGKDLVMGSDDGEQKVVNARRNPRAAVQIGGDPESDQAGYLIRGTITVEPDPGCRKLRRLYAKYGEALDERDDEWANENIVILRLKPTRVTRVW